MTISQCNIVRCATRVSTRIEVDLFDSNSVSGPVFARAVLEVAIVVELQFFGLCSQQIKNLKIAKCQNFCDRFGGYFHSRYGKRKNCVNFFFFLQSLDYHYRREYQW